MAIRKEREKMWEGWQGRGGGSERRGKKEKVGGVRRGKEKRKNGKQAKRLREVAIEEGGK